MKIKVMVIRPCGPIKVGVFPTERAARHAAARALGRESLRGAKQWPTEDGIGFQFGRAEQSDATPFAELTYL